MRGLEGNFQAQPRVFAHDAVLIVPGAINNTAVDDGLTVTNSGTGYAVGDTITLSTPAAGAVGDRAVVTVLAITAGGVVSDYSVTVVGAKYVSEPTPEAVTQALTSGTGVDFAASVVNNDVPNTQERGCCIYVGDISGGTNIKVTMESDNEITFTGVVAGSFLPILVKKVFNSGTTASGLIALY